MSLDLRNHRYRGFLREIAPLKPTFRTPKGQRRRIEGIKVNHPR